MEDLAESEEIYFLTPPRWNPHSDAHARNEESLLDWEGNIKPSKDREFRVILDGIEEDQTMTSSLHIGSMEGVVIDARMSSHTMVDDDDSVDGMSFYDALYSRAKDGDYMMSIGSTFASDLPTLEAVSEDSDSDSFEPNSDTEEDWFHAHEDDLDNYMVSAVASLASGVTPEHLSKVWRISHEEARRTIENTLQSSVRPKGVSLSCNDVTNDQMIRYRWIKDYPFMDSFFATKKGGKSP